MPNLIDLKIHNIYISGSSPRTYICSFTLLNYSNAKIQNVSAIRAITTSGIHASGSIKFIESLGIIYQVAFGSAGTSRNFTLYYMNDQGNTYSETYQSGTITDYVYSL